MTISCDIAKVVLSTFLSPFPIMKVNEWKNSWLVLQGAPTVLKSRQISEAGMLTVTFPTEMYNAQVGKACFIRS